MRRPGNLRTAMRAGGQRIKARPGGLSRFLLEFQFSPLRLRGNFLQGSSVFRSDLNWIRRCTFYGPGPCC
jgi:hypothetical protein